MRAAAASAEWECRHATYRRRRCTGKLYSPNRFTIKPTVVYFRGLNDLLTLILSTLLFTYWTKPNNSKAINSYVKRLDSKTLVQHLKNCTL